MLGREVGAGDVGGDALRRAPRRSGTHATPDTTAAEPSMPCAEVRLVEVLPAGDDARPRRAASSTSRRAARAVDAALDVDRAVGREAGHVRPRPRQVRLAPTARHRAMIAFGSSAVAFRPPTRPCWTVATDRLGVVPAADQRRPRPRRGPRDAVDVGLEQRRLRGPRARPPPCPCLRLPHACSSRRSRRAAHEDDPVRDGDGDAPARALGELERRPPRPTRRAACRPCRRSGCRPCRRRLAVGRRSRR